MSQADLSSPRRTRLGVAVLVGLLHVGVGLLLVRAFAPAFTAAVADRVTAALTVTVSVPSPSPTPTPRATTAAGAAAEVGRQAVPRLAAVPKPKIVLASPSPAPVVAGPGVDIAAGARDAGAGSGAGGQGSGTGSGQGGNGQGAGRAAAVVKLAGDINSARDYPPQSRALRLGDYVILALTIGIDGRVHDCRIVRPSRDAEADRITCRLATDRFRFRPASDAAGNSVESIYGWKQRWFDPHENTQQ